MTTAPDIHIVVGPDPTRLEPGAFDLLSSGRGTLRFCLGDDDIRRQLLGPGLRWEQVIVAQQGRRVLGFAAFKCRGRGGPYAPSLRDFIKVHGFSGWWRWLVFWLIEARDIRAEFYLYSFKIDRHSRGQGVARLLLDAVSAEARRRGVRYVELEVTDKHAKAQALYAHYGYRPRHTKQLGWVRRIFGFDKVRSMRLPLE
jgi:ribosomal protein S18 acetylase RimI-like enzyme